MWKISEDIFHALGLICGGFSFKAADSEEQWSFCGRRFT
jgi:hypothetical protein